MRIYSRKTIPFALVAVGVLAISSNAAERYKDRLFSVEKTKDVTYATNVPHLSSLHSLAAY